MRMGSAVIHHPAVTNRKCYAAGLLWPEARLPRQLVILTSGRSGSQLLVSLLNSRPDVLCQGEVLQSPSRLPPWEPDVLIRGYAVRAMRAARRAGEQPSVYGWKAASNDLRWHPSRYPDPTGFLRRCVGDDGLLVVLRRRNFVSQALSWEHANVVQYHFDRSSEFEQMKVDPEGLLAQAFSYEVEDNWIEEVAAPLDHLELFYEDDLRDPHRQQITANRVAASLGLPVSPVSTPYVRVSPALPSDRIANLDEVREVFSGSRYEALLGADRFAAKTALSAR
jgi:LPS sulfotransferase NodH